MRWQGYVTAEQVRMKVGSYAVWWGSTQVVPKQCRDMFRKVGIGLIRGSSIKDYTDGKVAQPLGLLERKQDLQAMET